MTLPGARPRRLLRCAPLLLVVQVACTSMLSSLPPPLPPVAPTKVVQPPVEAPTAAEPEPTPVALEPPATGSEVDRPEPQLPPVDVDVAIESTRESVRSTAEWLARSVDSWFGDGPFEQGGKVTDGRASVDLLLRETENPRLSLRFNARFRLPNVERQAYLFVGRDNPRELITDKPAALSNQDRLLAETAEDRSFFAGIGGTLSQEVDLRLGFRSAKPYAQARYHRGWEVGDRNLLEFRQTLFWTIQDSFGSTTALSWQRAYSPSMVARWLSAATITRDTRKFAWSSILGAYQSFGDRRLLSLEALVSGEEGTGVGASDYGGQVRWSQPIIKKRLLGEVVIGRFWPRSDPSVQRDRVWALGGNVKMEF